MICSFYWPNNCGHEHFNETIFGEYYFLLNASIDLHKLPMHVDNKISLVFLFCFHCMFFSNETRFHFISINATRRLPTIGRMKSVLCLFSSERECCKPEGHKTEID